ncbi:autophagy-related protein 13-domain-containing protein [Glomus cerebriforme]|uniref:Autophagy-related protein 13 n=1 Tax=Glomus cerebriforme TaxID=658196 RepID=A0A397TL42_9GLOM|nr:autophagy-related protein 13-domain-containing protein [Glomus cerebriforme]
MRRTPSQASPPPAPPYYSSPQEKKTEQIVQSFYTKVAQIITQARLIQYDSLSSGNIPPNTNLALNPRQTSHYQKRPNKWFNLEMWDSDVYKEDLKYWRYTATSTGLPPNPMIIEFFLDTSELPKNKILVITDEIRRCKVNVHNSGENEDSKPKNILLESWQLTLSHPSADPPPDLPIVYKKSIVFFRSLYAYVRLLPAFRLYKRIKMELNHDLKIGYRFVLPNADYIDDIGIDVPIIEGETNVSSQFTFGPIDTPLGALSLKAKYRTNCEFHIDESEEEMISANFMVDFDEQFFTPTVVKYYQEQEQRKQILKEERRKSVPTRMNTPPSGYLFPGHSPQYNNPLIGGTPQSNSDMNTELTFTKIHAPPSRLSSTSTLSNNTAPSLPRSSDSRRSLENQSSRGRHDNLSSSRPNVTLVQPFKSPSLSSSPSQDNLPSPTFSERSSPLHRSPSSLSLQQRSSRPLSLSGGGATLSSSVKSNSSAGSLTKFYTSFSYRHERNSGSNGRESGRESVSSRKRSRSSLTNRSDGSGGSFNSSFFASLDDAEDDVGEFVRFVDSREPLKMFSRSPTGPDDSENPGGDMSGSVYKSKQLQLSRFQKYKESHNTLSDSITSGPPQLDPPSGLTLGTLSGSVSSSSTMSSISKSTTHPPNVSSRLSANVTSDKQGEFIMPQSVQMPQISSGETHTLRPRSSNQTDNIIIGDYSPYSDELGHVDSSSLSSQNKLNYNQESQQQRDQLYNESNSESRYSIRQDNTEGMDIPKSNDNDDAFNGITDAGDITGSPALGNSLRVEDELLFSLNLSEERSFPVNAGVDNNEVIVKLEAINNTLGTTTDNNQMDIQKMSHIDEEV